MLKLKDLKDNNFEQLFSELTPQESSDINGGWTFLGNGVCRTADNISSSVRGTFAAIKGLTFAECAGRALALGIAARGMEYSEFRDPSKGPSLCELHIEPLTHFEIPRNIDEVYIDCWANP